MIYKVKITKRGMLTCYDDVSVYYTESENQQEALSAVVKEICGNAFKKNPKLESVTAFDPADSISIESISEKLLK